MFGAYQAGAWKALAPVLRPDMVVGSSVGALNGWAIAGGVEPEELIAQWSDPATAAMMQLHVPWRPWRGLFSRTSLEVLVREMAERCRPRVPYFATVVEVPRMKVRVFRGEEITWRHLLAICAVPFGFPPVRIGGRTYVDGGLLAALPLGTAVELGATRILALNAMPMLPSRVLRSGARLLYRAAAPPRPRPDPGLRIDVIGPPNPLGTLGDAVFWRAENMHAWIERGGREAEEYLRNRGSAAARVFD